MTQIALADRSGIPRNTLNRKINVGIFNFDELRRIACAVNRPLSSIVASAERLDSAEDAIPALGEGGLRVKMCVWLGVSRGLDLAFLNAD